MTIEDVDRNTAGLCPSAHQLTLRYRGTCVLCHQKLEPGQEAWYDPDAKVVTCVDCWPTYVALPPGRQVPTRAVGGASGFRQAEATGDQRWQRGAIGEYLMATHLHKYVRRGAVILTDRRVPGTRGNVDHIVVAPSGVWIVDAKNWQGKIEFEKTGGLGEDHGHLFVGGRDRTIVTDQVYRQVVPLAELLEDGSIPIHPAVVFVDGQWGARSALRMLSKKPYRHHGVWITWPKGLSSMINAGGPLSFETVHKLGRTLDARLELM